MDKKNTSVGCVVEWVWVRGCVGARGVWECMCWCVGVWVCWCECVGGGLWVGCGCGKCEWGWCVCVCGV